MYPLPCASYSIKRKQRQIMFPFFSCLFVFVLSIYAYFILALFSFSIIHNSSVFELSMSDKLQNNLAFETCNCWYLPKIRRNKTRVKNLKLFTCLDKLNPIVLHMAYLPQNSLLNMFWLMLSLDHINVRAYPNGPSLFLHVFDSNLDVERPWLP